MAERKIIKSADEFSRFQGLLSGRMMEIRKDQGVGFKAAHDLATKEVVDAFGFSESDFRSDLGYWRNRTGKATRRKTRRRIAAKTNGRANGNGKTSVVPIVPERRDNERSGVYPGIYPAASVDVPTVQAYLIPRVTSKKIESPRRRMVRSLLDNEMRHLDLRSGDGCVMDWSDVDSAQMAGDLADDVAAGLGYKVSVSVTGTAVSITRV